jgi:hypothetical protein
MDSKQTPIEQWIEENRLKYDISEQKRIGGIAAIHFSDACKELLTYLGLQDINDPKNHIRHLEFRANEGLQTSKELEDFKENAERLSLKYSFKIESLEVENERLKSVLKTLKKDAEMAISGEWDKSDKGFEDQITLINNTL